MLRIRFANYANDALSGYYLTILTAFFYRCLNFHNILSKKSLLAWGSASSLPIPARLPLLFIPISNPAFAEVVRRKLDGHPVALQDFDVIHPHFTGNTRQNFVTVFELNPKRRVRQCLINYAIYFDCSLFGHQYSRYSRGAVLRACQFESVP
jgi:hypothetical protein